jgi:hypothetical protein
MKTLIILVFSIFVLPASILAWSDNFNRGNSSTVDGWTEQAGDWSIESNRLKAQTASSWQYITYNNSSCTNGILQARAIYGSASSVQFIGLTARYSSTSVYVMGKIQDNSSSGNWNRVFIYCNESMLTYADITATTDAEIQLEFSGSTVTFRIDRDRNGTWDYAPSTTVSNTGSGLVGANGYYGSFLDDWWYGTALASIIDYFNINPLSMAALVEWSTTTESNLIGFNLLRSLKKRGAYSNVFGGMILAHLGDPEGYEYLRIDNGLLNNEKYWYLLEAVFSDGSKEITDPLSVKPGSQGNKIIGLSGGSLHNIAVE